MKKVQKIFWIIFSAKLKWWHDLKYQARAGVTVTGLPYLLTVQFRYYNRVSLYTLTVPCTDLSTISVHSPYNRFDWAVVGTRSDWLVSTAGDILLQIIFSHFLSALNLKVGVRLCEWNLYCCCYLSVWTVHYHRAGYYPPVWAVSSLLEWGV